MIEGKIAHYLQKHFPNLFIDIDYNRAGDSVKRILGYIPQPGGKCGRCQSFPEDDKSSFWPDIIIHERGKNDDNLLVIELKKGGHTEKLYEDCRKPCYMTDKEKRFKYEYGMGIVLYQDHADIRLLQEGELNGLYRFDCEKKGDREK